MRQGQIKFAAACLFMLLLLIAQTIRAQTTAFTYQGKLNDAGQPANANYDMQFRLFDNPNAGQGTQQGSTITRPTVLVSGGLFNVELDFGTAVLSGGANLFLEISLRPAGNMGGYTSLNPRQKLTSAPYSVRAIGAGSADGLSGACALCVQDAHINSVDGGKVTGAVMNATNALNATTAENVSGVVAISNGGTGSAKQNFVDLTTDQTIDGNKTFNGTVSATSLSGNGSGLTSVIQIQRFYGNILNVTPLSGLLFIGPTTEATVNGSQRVTGSAVAALGTSSGTSSVFTTLCYQSTSGGTIFLFNNNAWISPIITTDRASFAVSETSVPPAGTYRFGFCLANGNVTLNNNAGVQGWIMITNN